MIAITGAFLKSLMGSLSDVDTWAAKLTDATTTYRINTDQRFGMFLAQSMYESALFSQLVEDLDYTAQGLLRTFPRYFDATSATDYAHKPAAIANHVYANRFGNGNEASGDGFRYCGKGLLQITFKDAYGAFANAIGMDIASTPAYCQTIEGACISAGWFWASKNLNTLADRNDFTSVTEVISGSDRSLADRNTLWTKVKAAMASDVEALVA